MPKSPPKRPDFLKRLASENRESYGTEVGQGTLRALDLVFEHRWVYFFELIQNAMDAGASSIEIRIADDGDSVVFQHNGRRPIEEKDVRALSRVFLSTKGATTVGFMGIGFKSVFGRFREARISGWGWKFRFQVESQVGERFGDIQPDLLGTTIPVPDSSIPDPDDAFTTRFELSERADPAADLHSDLAQSLPEDDHAPLAILAAHGLRQIDIDGERWNLEVRPESSGCSLVTARSNGRRRRWQMFSVGFTPSDRAVRRLVEHRRIPRGGQNAAAQRRQVIGLAPLAEDGTPAPPDRGGIYASLRTDATMPLGLHLNADWLLNISRSGFREIEDNEWQAEIADRIADLVALYLRWGASSFSGVDAVRALFEALGSPAKSATGPESLIAREAWLSRLRAKLEDEPVLPVWTADPERVAFHRPSEVSVMPPPLNQVASDCEGFRPDALFPRPVLRRDLLDSEAFALLDDARVLRPLSSETLRRDWAEGLEHWWKTLPKKKTTRRRLLGCLWGALSRLDETWRATTLRCVRTATKKWKSLEEAIFLREALPTDKEPGGKRVRRLLRRYLPSESAHVSPGWVQVLSTGRARSAGDISTDRDLSLDWLDRAWTWVRQHDRSVTLKAVVGDAVQHFVASEPGRTGAMVSLGHWARHRNRPDLLAQVVVGSGPASGIVPIRRALLAEPYLADGANRRRLFPEWPAVTDKYHRKDPAGKSTAEWAAFLRKAGARHTAVVREQSQHYERWYSGGSNKAERRLGLAPGELGRANSLGYEVIDFEIEPQLPGSSAPAEQRFLLAEWLADDYEALKGKGRLRCRYEYRTHFEQEGRAPATWVSKLRELEWAPDGDGRLRRPAEVLPQLDPSRPEAPAAALPPGLVRALAAEGVAFGVNIPEAPLLSRLAAVGSRLGADELVALLRECREETLGAADAEVFLRTVENLEVPLDGRLERVPVRRIVKGGRRGTLHGHIARFDDLAAALRDELDHPIYEIPGTTTGAQALALLRSVWQRARTSPEGLANEVREALPAAYSYCLDDANEDPALQERWKTEKGEAAVFADRRWIRLADEETVYLDDVDDRRFFPDGESVLTATAGHLGASPEAQKRTAGALGLPLLSNSVEKKWRGEYDRVPVDQRWSERFDFVYELLRRLRSRDSVAGATGSERPGEHPTLARTRRLTLVVSLEGGAPRTVDIRARLSGSELLVAGEPQGFGADAAKELLRRFAFGQRAEMATDLAAMLFSLDNEEAFRDAAGQFRDAYLPDFDLPSQFREREEPREEAGETALGTDEEESVRGEPASTPRSREPATADRHARSEGRDSTKASDHNVRPSQSVPDERRAGAGPAEGSGSYTKNRALAPQKALAANLERSLKGEIVPDRPARTAEGEHEYPGPRAVDRDDEPYRKAAARYERKFGRVPEDGARHQVGWDLRSRDPHSGAVRLIEVKGRRHPWTGDEVVELSRAQVLTAFRSVSNEEEGEWYLYVVERTEEGGYRVLPIRNPVEAAAKWMVSGGAWRAIAEDARTLPPE